MQSIRVTSRPPSKIRKWNLEKLNQSNNPVAFNVKMDQPVLELGLLGWDCL